MLVFIENFVDIWKHGIKVCDKIDFRFTVVVCFLLAYKCQMSLDFKCFIDFSDLPHSEGQAELLCRGLSFTPTPSQIQQT